MMTTNWALKHVQAFLKACGDITRRPITSMMVFIVLGIALTIPASMAILIKNLQNVVQGFHHETQISVYLKPGTSPANAQNLLKQIQKNPAVRSAQYISPDEGLKRFSKNSDFNDVLADLPNNPLPGVIAIEPTSNNTLALKNLSQQIQNNSAVDQVQLDYAWLDRLLQISEMAKRIVTFLAILLGLGAVLIIWNTIHLILQEHHREINLYQLVGATRSFIRRPYLYMGLIYGLLSGIIAWIIVTIATFWLQKPAEKLALSYGSQFQLHGFGVENSLLLFIIAAGLGLLGAVVALQRPLNQA